MIQEMDSIERKYRKLYLVKTMDKLQALQELVLKGTLPGYVNPLIYDIFFDDEVTYGQNNIVRFEEINK